MLPMAIPQRTWVAVAARAGTTARAASGNLGRGQRIREFEVGRRTAGARVAGLRPGLHAGHAQRRRGAGSIRPVRALRRAARQRPLVECRARGRRDARAPRALLDSRSTMSRLARLGQRAENDFVGAPVGVMDQMAASLADAHTALFLDTRSLTYEQVPLPAGGALVVINSGVAHNHASGDYRTRRAECERAAAALGVAQLRDLTTADLDRVMRLPDPENRRARHVVTEDQRVLDAVDAMKHGEAGTPRRPLLRIARITARRFRGVRARNRSFGRADRRGPARVRCAAHWRGLRWVCRAARP